MPAIVDIFGGPFASGTSLNYTGQIVDVDGVGIPAGQLRTLTLTIADTGSGMVVNGVSQVDILNTGRGSVDDQGNLLIALLPGDTTLASPPSPVQSQRSLVIDWVSTTNVYGRHQVNFQLVNLVGL